MLWDKGGVGHFGRGLPNGGHSVAFLDFSRRVVPEDLWPQFLEEQKELLASRTDQARKGGPILVAKIQLPSGKVIDQIEDSWSLEEKTTNEYGNSTNISSGCPTSPYSFKWSAR